MDILWDHSWKIFSKKVFVKVILLTHFLSAHFDVVCGAKLILCFLLCIFMIYVFFFHPDVGQKVMCSFDVVCGAK